MGANKYLLMLTIVVVHVLRPVVNDSFPTAEKNNFHYKSFIPHQRADVKTGPSDVKKNLSYLSCFVQLWP